MLNDIKTLNKSIEDGEKGFLLVFPAPQTGAVSIKDLYVLDFEVADRLPKVELNSDRNHRISFIPSLENDSEKASILTTSISSNINIGLKITSIHKAETRTLIKLKIKDIYNTVLYIDYILVICSPKQTISLPAQLVPGSSTDSIGPNGGRILTVNNTNEELLSQLFSRMIVQGPGIPTNQDITIFSFVDNDRTRIELMPFFTNDPDLSYTGNYTFTNIFSCPSDQDLAEIFLKDRVVVLEENNNWSYFFRNKLVAQFIPNTGINNYQDLVILLDTKNFDILIPNNEPAKLPEISFIRAKGRVNNDQDCLNSI